MEQKIITTEDYKAFKADLKARLISQWETVSERDRGALATKIAAELDISKTTVINYYSGMGADPETGLSIAEKFNELSHPLTSNKH